jgi:hypothetical protein
MINGLAIGLAGNTAFAVYDFHKPVQTQRNSFIDPGSIVWKNKFERDRFELSYATRLNRAAGLYVGWRP